MFGCAADLYLDFFGGERRQTPPPHAGNCMGVYFAFGVGFCCVLFVFGQGPVAGDAAGDPAFHFWGSVTARGRVPHPRRDRLYRRGVFRGSWVTAFNEGEMECVCMCVSVCMCV